MLALGSFITLIILAGIAVLVKWMASSMAISRSADSITPEDLKVLEEASARLVGEIKETASLAIRDLDDRCEQLRKLILLADQKIMLWSQIAEEQSERDSQIPQTSVSEEAGPAARIYELADAGLEPTDIARETDQPIGEVTLLLGLRSAVRT